NYVPSQPSRPTFGEDEIRSLVHDALGHLPFDSRLVRDSMFEDNVGESSQSSHRRVEDENISESSKTSDDSATYKKLLEECESSNAKKLNKTAKVLRYFPLILRLKRIYMSEKITKDMRWHNMGRTMDEKLRHPTDGLDWKGFDARYLDFASDPQKAPENDIDVYLQPLIHELKLLWKGVDAYDAFSKQKLKLRASIIWLEKNHKYRIQNDQFDGTCEEEGPPTSLTGFDILEQLSGASFIYGKSDNSSNKSNKRIQDGVGCSTNAHDEANAQLSAFEDIENYVEEETSEHLL
nr:hypothetical protein [Tanacetum cinerariifolium]